MATRKPRQSYSEDFKRRVVAWAGLLLQIFQTKSVVAK